MKYFYDYKVKYQEVDDRKKLRLFNLENYLLEVAGTVADELGFGIAQLHPIGLTWIITRLSAQMYELPGPCEHLRIETWIESNAHMLSTRDFRIYAGDKLIGQVKSVWAVLDMNKREIVNAFDMPIFEGCVDGEVLDMPRVRMTTIPEPTGSVPHTIVYSDLDYNKHCNSCKYLQAMIDAYLPDYYGKNVRIDINYSKEVMLGEELMTCYLVTEDGVQYQQKTSAGETSCSAKITITPNP
ncbi:MAG: hypothetical protein II605_05895 [Paludibacteraceae bacterium]|nr:hypothetical protein [Paludibacteraceae bacterium]